MMNTPTTTQTDEVQIDANDIQPGEAHGAIVEADTLVLGYHSNRSNSDEPLEVTMTDIERANRYGKDIKGQDADADRGIEAKIQTGGGRVWSTKNKTRSVLGTLAYVRVPGYDREETEIARANIELEFQTWSHADVGSESALDCAYERNSYQVRKLSIAREDFSWADPFVYDDGYKVGRFHAFGSVEIRAFPSDSDEEVEERLRKQIPARHRNEPGTVKEPKHGGRARPKGWLLSFDVERGVEEVA